MLAGIKADLLRFEPHNPREKNLVKIHNLFPTATIIGTPTALAPVTAR